MRNYLPLLCSSYSTSQNHNATFQNHSHMIDVSGFRRAYSKAVEIPKPKLPKFAIIDTTLREGEQFSTAEFTHYDRVYIAKMLDSLGVEYIELVNPAASDQAVKDCEAISRLNLKSKILTHVRCHMHDVKVAVGTGVQGVNVYMATSKVLREHSHGKGIDAIVETAAQVIEYVKKHGLEIRFSCEDAFRSDLNDILKIYGEVSKLGVDRVGVADTVGVATPFQVQKTIEAVRSVINSNIGIEFHTHNDTGCCIANALVALEAGATHIDTCVLGIGERNGITPLGGFLSRMYTIDKDEIKRRYNLSLIRSLEKYVATCAEISIPFNNYITGSASFTHKAGVHSKAVMLNPSAYEVIDPGDFGVERKIQLAHRLTGWNAMANRAKQLGLDISDDQIKAATTKIKNLADQSSIKLDQVDAILMKLAAGPRTSSSAFVTWGSSPADPKLKAAAEQAMKAVSQYEAMIADQAINEVKTSQQDFRKTACFEVKGHLFDKAILNRLLDMAVDSTCEFKFEEIKVAQRDEDHSAAIFRLYSDSQDQLNHTISLMKAFIDSTAPIAECVMNEIKEK